MYKSLTQELLYLIWTKGEVTIEDLVNETGEERNVVKARIKTFLNKHYINTEYRLNLNTGRYEDILSVNEEFREEFKYHMLKHTSFSTKDDICYKMISSHTKMAILCIINDRNVITSKDIKKYVDMEDDNLGRTLTQLRILGMIIQDGFEADSFNRYIIKTYSITREGKRMVELYRKEWEGVL